MLSYTRGEGKEVAVQTDNAIGNNFCRHECNDMFSYIQVKLDKILSMMALPSEKNPVTVDFDEFILPTSLETSPSQLQLSSPDLTVTTNTSPNPRSVNSSTVPDSHILPVDPTPEHLGSNASTTLTPFITSSSITSSSLSNSLSSDSISITTPPANTTQATLPVIQNAEPMPPRQTTPPLQLNNPTSAIYEETYKESASMGNYAKNLVFKLFEKDELVGSNCIGAKGKRSLETDQRMQLVKDAVFRKYYVDDKKKSWAACRKAVDCAIRHIK